MSVNKQAEQHLAKAEKFIGQGDEFYRKAAEEIVAARAADPTLSFREIGDRFGKGSDWAERLVTWVSNGDRDRPFGGEIRDERRHRSVTRKVLRENPEIVAEEIAAAIAENPEVARAVVRSDAAVSAIGSEGMSDTLAHHREHHTGVTVGDALQDPKLRQQLSEQTARQEVERTIRRGIRAIAEMDVDEFIGRHAWEYDSDEAPSLRTVARDLDAAIDNLQTLRDRITAKLLTING